MMMTLSPSSTSGVNVGLCLPRRRLATREARRPTTRPSASISTHFFVTSAGFCEKVFMVLFPYPFLRENRQDVSCCLNRWQMPSTRDLDHDWGLIRGQLTAVNSLQMFIIEREQVKSMF